MRGGVLERGVSKGGVFAPVLAVLAAALIVGCGGGSSATSTTTTVPSSPAASTQGSSASVDAVALVSSTAISKASYEHWLAVEKALGAGANPSHQALAFLLTSQWVLGEAAGRKISASEAEVKRRFAQIKQQSFPKAGSFAEVSRLLRRDRSRPARARAASNCCESRIVAQVDAGKSASQSQAALASFERAFQRHWRSYTTCKPGYVMEDCSEYKGAPENLTAAGRSIPRLRLELVRNGRRALLRGASLAAPAASFRPRSSARWRSRAPRSNATESSPSSTPATAPTSARRWNGRTSPPRPPRWCCS